MRSTAEMSEHVIDKREWEIVSMGKKPGTGLY